MVKARPLSFRRGLSSSFGGIVRMLEYRRDGMRLESLMTTLVQIKVLLLKVSRTNTSGGLDAEIPPTPHSLIPFFENFRAVCGKTNQSDFFPIFTNLFWSV